MDPPPATVLHALGQPGTWRWNGCAARGSPRQVPVERGRAPAVALEQGLEHGGTPPVAAPRTRRPLGREVERRRGASVVEVDDRDSSSPAAGRRGSRRGRASAPVADHSTRGDCRPSPADAPPAQHGRSRQPRARGRKSNSDRAGGGLTRHRGGRLLRAAGSGGAHLHPLEPLHARTGMPGRARLRPLARVRPSRSAARELGVLDWCAAPDDSRGFAAATPVGVISTTPRWTRRHGPAGAARAGGRASARRPPMMAIVRGSRGP